MSYTRRIVDLELDDLFGEVAALALDGPKGVGKTTTAEQRATGLVKLDSKAVREPVAADPQIILRRPRPLLVDEWQKVSEVWDVVRRAVDEDAAGGQFLLTGSASPQNGTVQHSGAGRIGRLRMRPMTLAERGVVIPTVSLAAVLAERDAIQGESTMGLPEYVEEIVASGFPGMRGLSSRARGFQLDSYLRNAVERDVPEQGLAVRRPEAMMAWLRAYASASSTTASYSQILDAATPGDSEKPARATAESYRHVLASLWLLDPVPAWSPVGSPMTRLGQAPKHHLADPALAARLLGLGADALAGWQGGATSSAGGFHAGNAFRVAGDAVRSCHRAGSGGRRRTPADAQRRPRGGPRGRAARRRGCRGGGEARGGCQRLRRQAPALAARPVGITVRGWSDHHDGSDRLSAAGRYRRGAPGSVWPLRNEAA